MPITQLDIERFTQGDCHILARAIHRITDWYMAAFEDEDGTPANHVFIKLPTRHYPRYLDIEGIVSPQRMRVRWCQEDGMPISTFTEEEIEAAWQMQDGTSAFHPAYGRYSLRRAAQLAPRLVVQATGT